MIKSFENISLRLITGKPKDLLVNCLIFYIIIVFFICFKSIAATPMRVEFTSLICATDKIVCLGVPDRVVICVNEEGDISWRLPVDDIYPFAVWHGRVGEIVVGRFNEFMVIDILDGKILRHFPVIGVVVDVASNGDILVLEKHQIAEGPLRSYSSETGEVRWVYPFDKKEVMYCGSHVMLLPGHFNLSSKEMDIICINGENGEKIWEEKLAPNPRNYEIISWTTRECGEFMLLLTGPYLYVIKKSDATLLFRTTIAPVPSYRDINRLQNWQITALCWKENRFVVAISNPLENIVKIIDNSGKIISEFPGVRQCRMMEILGDTLYSGCQKMDLNTGKHLLDDPRCEETFFDHISEYTQKGKTIYFAGCQEKDLNTTTRYIGKLNLLTGEKNMLYSEGITNSITRHGQESSLEFLLRWFRPPIFR